jgi:hypothetical protein
LADDVLLEEVIDFLGLGEVKISRGGLATLRLALIDDFVAQFDALITDIDAGPGDELLDLLLAFTAERAIEKLA